MQKAAERRPTQANVASYSPARGHQTSVGFCGLSAWVALGSAVALPPPG